MTAADDSMIGFGRFEIDRRRQELRRDGQIVPVEPQVLDLIAFLAAHPGRVLSRDEIIAGVWNGRIVSDSAISTRINAARHALDDDGKAQRVIRTVPRRGFLFAADVAAAPGPTAGNPALQDRPSVAVMPFDNRSDDPEQTYFSDGITDDIITDLARYGELFVIARHSSFAYRDGARDMQQIARELGAQYIVEGSVRRAGQRVRVTVQLVDAGSGNHLWADRFDRDMEDIFAVQDEITAVIVNTLAGQLGRQHYRRTLLKGPDAIHAYDHAARAMELMWKIGQDANRAARAEAEQAVRIDPSFARAHALISFTHVTEASNRWTDDVPLSFERMYGSAVAAVAADDREPWAHMALGWSHLWRDHAHDRALVALQRGIALNPSNAHFRSLYALGLIYSGRSAEAADELQTAMRLNPHYPVLYQCFLARALLLLGRFDEALPHVEPILTAMPEHSNALALVASCYAALGRDAEAQAAARALLRAAPDYTLRNLHAAAPYARAEDLEFFLRMLRKAGLPE